MSLLRRAPRPKPIADDRPRDTWVTAAGDVVTVLPARVAPGSPQRWYWYVQAPNGRIVASSGQGFTRPRSARRAAARSFPPGDPA